MQYFDSQAIATTLTPTTAVAALAAALETGLDVESDAPRLFSDLPQGEFLLMPARIPASGELPAAAGVKVLTVAPHNPAVGLPKIQGTYLLFDGEALAPIATIAGAEITLVRTPAVTVLALTRMRGLAPIDHLLVYGSGPQAAAHIAFLAAFVEIRSITIAGRTPERATPLIDQLRAAGHAVEHARPNDVETADVVICASSSSTPLFDGSRVKDDAVIAAIGTHGTDAREVDEQLVARADIVVEARSAALRESGNLLQAAPVQHWIEHPPANLGDLVHGRFVRTPGRPALYTACGMSWEDLVLARALVFAPAG